MYKVIRKDDNKLLGIEDSEFKAHDLIFFDIDQIKTIKGQWS